MLYKNKLAITVNSINLQPTIFDGEIIFMDNTVGSLTQLQKSVIIGSLLGDGYVRKIPGRKDAFLEINHSFAQRDYVDWKYKMFENVSGNPPKRRKGNGGRIAYRFLYAPNAGNNVSLELMVF